MGSEYVPAIDMFLDENLFPFINALNEAKGDISIVIHGTGSPGGIPSAQQIALYYASLASTSDRKSSHFVIGQDGVVVQCISLADGAGANCCVEANYDQYWTPYLRKYGNLNKCTISIEHCSDSNNSSYSTKQLEASYALVQWLCAKFSIPFSRIKGHNSIDPISRARCPGAYPMASLIAHLSASSPIAQAAFDTWHSVTFSGSTLPYDTGIAKAWQSKYLSGHNMAPPTTPEFSTVRWDNTPIKAQIFGCDRCEWYGGNAFWYKIGF